MAFLSMGRFYIIIAALLVIIMTSNSYAADQSVALRVAKHDGYSRLVFDWPEKTGYNVGNNGAGTVTVTFNETADLDQSKANLSAINDITAIQQISSNPLKIQVNLSKSYKTKHFKIGNRIILDVLSDDNASASKASPFKTAAKTLKASSSKKAPVPKVEETNEPKSSDEKNADGREVAIKPVIKAVTRSPNAITVSSVGSTNMAAFILNDRLWLVNDQEDILLSPQLSGKQTKDIGPVDIQRTSNAKLFIVNALRGAEYLTQGGGLVWRFLIGDKIEGKAPVKPTRSGGVYGEGRDGRLVWAFQSPGEIVAVTDPDSGIEMITVTVETEKDYAGAARDFVDFKTLQSPLGLTIVPKVDDLIVEETEEGIVVSRAGGLAITGQSDIDLAVANSDKQQPDDAQRKKRKGALYDFENWQLGGIEAIPSNKAVILSGLLNLTPSGQGEGLLSLAKMYLANGMAAESLGFLDAVSKTLPTMKDSPEFQAIKGAALALQGRNEEAFKMLSGELLADKKDVRNWRSFALAKLQDWQQAEELLPNDFEDIYFYPTEILTPLALTLNEVALRAGDLDRANELFALLTPHEDDMRAPHKAALTYLKGEAARQNGKIDEAIKYWTDNAEGEDDLYRVRGGLALTRLEQEHKDLPLGEVIDRLERLRYAWRGDNLEAHVNYRLGRTYFDIGEYVKGLNIMRDAASYASGPTLGARITAEMAEEFQDLFTGDKLNDLPAPDAAALYERFSELNPGDEAGDEIAGRLADRLVQANLYDKAIDILTYQLDNRLTGRAAYNAAKRLAVVQQFNDNPGASVLALNKAQTLRNQIPDLLDDESETAEVAILKARALSQNDESEKALELLRSVQSSPNNNRLYADIAWQHGHWAEAAFALGNVLEDQNVGEESLTEPQAELVLQRAVALSLADDRIRLANMRQKYTTAMNNTNRRKVFEVITRQRQNAELADRQTLLSIVSEVDLFSEVLDEYRAGQEADKAAEAVSGS